MIRKTYVKTLILFILLNLMFIGLKNTYGYWDNVNNTNAEHDVIINTGTWKEKLPILEQEKKLVNLSAGDKFVWNKNVWVILEGGPSTVYDDINWSGWNDSMSKVNILSDDYINVNYYDNRSSEVIYNNNTYLANNILASYTSPNNSIAWFKVDEAYVPENFYPNGYIVRYDVNGVIKYWISNSIVIPYSYPGNNNNWTEIVKWNKNSNPKNASIVYTIKNNEIKFWRYNKKTSLAPSEETSKLGSYSELKNGWLSSIDNFTYTWFAHNVYAKNEIVVYGNNQSNRLRFFKSLTNSNINRSPIVEINGKEEVNSKYWVEI